MTTLGLGRPRKALVGIVPAALVEAVGDIEHVDEIARPGRNGNAWGELRKSSIGFRTRLPTAPVPCRSLTQPINSLSPLGRGVVIMPTDVYSVD